MDEEAWCAAVHGVTESRTRLSNCTELKAKLVQHCYVLCYSMWGCGTEHGFWRQRVLGYNLCSVPLSFIYSADIQCMPPTWSCLDRPWAEAGSRKLELLVQWMSFLNNKQYSLRILNIVHNEMAAEKCYKESKVWWRDTEMLWGGGHIQGWCDVL